MSTRSERELDGALAALAREALAAAPAPDADLVARVMADAALCVLAREAAGAAPSPSPGLVARVLADAAEAVRPAPAAAEERARAGGMPARAGLLDWLFGWQGGAVAAMALALAIGIGIGLETEPGTLPVLDARIDDTSLAFAGFDAGLGLVEGL